ncbi:MAG TPA: O-antigen ligase family protein [Gaiellaceae bacterium]|nr:O-antigen ligase family protein [Gaiellaceae bacterium]
MRAAGERVTGLWAAAGAAAASFLALFFGGGDSRAPLVWIGAVALLLAALCVLEPFVLDGPAALYLGGLAGLAVVCGVSSVWSISPDRTWTTTNRTIVYAGFALVGVAVGARVARARIAECAAALLALVAGWALLAKCVPALYPRYGSLARLQAPVGYWNELALLCDAGVPIALWLAARRRRVDGAVLLYALTLTLLLTYSRFGVVLAGAAALAWTLVDRDRVESIAVLALGGVAGVAVFGVALALPGITSDGEPRSVRAHDGWIFALVVVAAAGIVAAAAAALRTRTVAPELRARLERGAAIAGAGLAVVGIVLCVVFARRIWHEFANPGNTQVVNTQGRLASVRSDRWAWWQEAWHAFTRHPLGGTGAGTFELTNQMLRHAPVVVDEPHSMPLQFLSETGLAGFALYLAAAAGALWGGRRARRDPAGLALGLAVAAFFVHGVADKDWNYVATCGPLCVLGGALVARPRSAPARRRTFLAAAAVVVALACIYSLAAPWLGDRAYARGTEQGAKQAHSYDPLSVDALALWATYEDISGDLAGALEHYQEAVRLEPENADTWYALGAFYAEHKQWALAYDALNNSYTYDRFGSAAMPCGLLDQARAKTFHFVPKQVLSRCPALRRAASP